MSTCVWYLLEKQGCVGVFSFVGHSHSSDNAKDIIKICVGFTPSTGTPFSLCTGHLQHHMSMCVFVLTHWHSSLQRTRIKKDSWRKRKRKALFDLHGDSVCAIQFTSAWSWVFPFYSALQQGTLLARGLFQVERVVGCSPLFPVSVLT